MSDIEHYFENLLYFGHDAINKDKLTAEERNAVEQCVNYVIYDLFGSIKSFNRFLEGDFYLNESLGFR